MSDLYGTFPQPEQQPDRQPVLGVEPQELLDAPEPTQTDRFEATEDGPTVEAEAAAPEEAAAPQEAAEEDAAADDGFDRVRVLRLLDRLERDVAAVEAAMVHVEAGEHEAYAAAVATIDVQLAD